MTDRSNEPERNGAADERRTTPVVHRIDSVICLIILVVSLALFYATTRFETVIDVLSQNIGPGLFPQILLVVIIVLTLALPVEHLFLERGAEQLDKERSDTIRPLTWATIGLLTLAVALMPLLGTVLTMVAVCLAMPWLWGERRARMVVPFALLFPAAVTIVFSLILKVHFQPGLLGLLSH
jgi:putative tricarboxylic transport membrane protein